MSKEYPSIYDQKRDEAIRLARLALEALAVAPENESDLFNFDHARHLMSAATELLR
jgi:hypothetical protein